MDTKQQRLYELKSQIIQAVAHPIRLAVIDFLGEDEQCVCDIVDYVGAQRTNVSRHLGVMLKAGVVESRKDGLKVYYKLRTPCIIKFLDCVTEALRQRVEDESALINHL